MYEMSLFGDAYDMSDLFTEKEDSNSFLSTAKLLLFEDLYWPFMVSDPTPGASW